ncbi:hypothetical protein [Amycolatopsis australiensis]|uniref:Uncharacterized protein n=1 Tax=Amycolatopsis australiensis TaxID=546364 RepID=A0A1K1T6E2_9PSEU|nr:hypothetical protein [Amycolatopsis australiensis]SFW92108.1 hypothetical protein SAMN04489730_8389 [Amycolatopsis australiensis]
MTAGRSSDPVITPELARAFWAELRGPRAATHRSHHVGLCDTELRIAGLRLSARGSSTADGGFRLSGGCPCRDLVADAFEVVWAFVADRGHRFDNLAGAVRTDLRFRLVELDRRARRDRGAPVKPQTVRDNRYGRALPDEFHREVFVMLADEAGARGPLRGEAGLLGRLADRCADKFGGHAATHAARLPQVLRTVERVCRTGPRVNVGTVSAPELVTWWEAYVERPLGRRPDPDSPTGEEPEILDHDTSREFDRIAALTDDAVLALLLTEVWPAPGTDRDDALCEVIRVFARRGLLPHRRALELLADDDGRQDVLERLEHVSRRLP